MARGDGAARVFGLQSARHLADSKDVANSGSQRTTLALAALLAFAAASVPLLICVVIAGLLVAATAAGMPPTLLHLFAFAGVIICSLRLRDAVREARRGDTADDRLRQLALGAAGGVGAYDVTAGLQRLALNLTQGGATLPPSAAPGLEDFVHDAARAAGWSTETALDVLLVPEPWMASVHVHPKSDVVCVLIGAAALTTSTEAEFRAGLIYELALARQTGALRRGRLVRTAATTALLVDRRGRERSFGFLLRLAGPAGRAAERAGTRYAAAARAAAAQLAGPSALEVAMTREAVACDQWLKLLADAQRQWQQSGEAVRPFASWIAAMQAAGAARTPAPLATPAGDVWSAAGWPLPDPSPGICCPPSGPASALDAIAGPAAARTLDDLDDLLAAAYYGEEVSEEFGERVAWDDAERSVPVALQPGADIDAQLTTFDPASPTPLFDLAERQVDALHAACERPDRQALAVAAAIERAPVTATAQAMAAGVALLAEDPGAPARLASALKTDPAVSAVVGGLSVRLRTAGETQLAQDLDRSLTALGRALETDLRLDHVCGGRSRVWPSTLGPAAASLVAEVIRLLPSSCRAWLIDVRLAQGGVAPVLVLEDALGDRDVDDSIRVLREHAWALHFAVPQLRIMDRTDLELSARLMLWRRGTKLAVQPDRLERAAAQRARASAESAAKTSR